MKKQLITAMFISTISTLSFATTEVKDCESNDKSLRAHIEVTISDSNIKIGEKLNYHYRYSLQMFKSEDNPYTQDIGYSFINCHGDDCKTDNFVMWVNPSTGSSSSNNGIHYGGTIINISGTYKNAFRITIPSLKCEATVYSETTVS